MHLCPGVKGQSGLRKPLDSDVRNKVLLIFENQFLILIRNLLKFHLAY